MLPILPILFFSVFPPRPWQPLATIIHCNVGFSSVPALFSSFVCRIFLSAPFSLFPPIALFMLMISQCRFHTTTPGYVTLLTVHSERLPLYYYIAQPVGL